jgi:hypothetical protein
VNHFIGTLLVFSFTKQTNEMKIEIFTLDRISSSTTGSGSAQSTATFFPHSSNRSGRHFLRAKAAARCDSYSMKANPLFFFLSATELNSPKIKNKGI